MFRDPQVQPDTRDTSAQDHEESPSSEDSCIRHKLARQKVNMLLELHAIDEHHWTWCYSCRCVVTTPPCATVQDHNWNSVKLTTSALDSGHTIATIEPRYEAMQAESFLSALAWHCVISSSFSKIFCECLAKLKRQTLSSCHTCFLVWTATKLQRPTTKRHFPYASSNSSTRSPSFPSQFCSNRECQIQARYSWRPPRSRLHDIESAEEHSQADFANTFLYTLIPICCCCCCCCCCPPCCP